MIVLCVSCCVAALGSVNAHEPGCDAARSTSGSELGAAQCSSAGFGTEVSASIAGSDAIGSAAAGDVCSDDVVGSAVVIIGVVAADASADDAVALRSSGEASCGNVVTVIGVIGASGACGSLAIAAAACVVASSLPSACPWSSQNVSISVSNSVSMEPSFAGGGWSEGDKPLLSAFADGLGAK